MRLLFFSTAHAWPFPTVLALFLSGALSLLSSFSPSNLQARSSDPEAKYLFDRSFKKGDVEAARDLRRAVSIEPGYTDAHFRLGFLYQKMNFREEAAEEYKTTIAQDPCHTKALINLGNLMSDAHRSNEAIGLYKKAIHCSPDFYAGYYNLAIVEPSRRQSLLEKALQKNPDHFGSLFLLAQTLRSVHPDRALAYLDRACAVKEEPRCLQDLGQWYAEEGLPSKARKAWKRALYLSKHPVQRQEIRRMLQNLDRPSASKPSRDQQPPA